MYAGAMRLAAFVLVVMAACASELPPSQAPVARDDAFLALGAADRLAWIDCRHAILPGGCDDDAACDDSARAGYAAVTVHDRLGWLVAHGCPRSTVAKRLERMQAPAEPFAECFGPTGHGFEDMLRLPAAAVSWLLIEECRERRYH
jgi:hypothetical protein